MDDASHPEPVTGGAGHRMVAGSLRDRVMGGASIRATDGQSIQAMDGQTALVRSMADRLWRSSGRCRLRDNHLIRHPNHRGGWK